MKRTPQKAITSASVSRRLAGQIEAVADEIRKVLDLGLLIIMGEDHGVALVLQALDLAKQIQAPQIVASEPSFLPLQRACARASLIASSYGVERSR